MRRGLEGYMWKNIVIMVYLTVLGIMDIKERKLPVWLLGVSGILAFCVAMLGRLNWGSGVSSALLEVILGMLPGAFLLAMAFLTKKIGYGDGIVLLQLGCIYGYMHSLAFLCVSLFLLSIVAMIFLASKKVKNDTPLPYIPFLAVTFAGYVFING